MFNLDDRYKNYMLLFNFETPSDIRHKSLPLCIQCMFDEQISRHEYFELRNYLQLIRPKTVSAILSFIHRLFPLALCHDYRSRMRQ